ncbi:hypothetical protein MCEGKSE7_01328 [Candidatus Nanopelagicaceae bacterium]
MFRILIALVIALGALTSPAAQADSCALLSSDWVARENSKAGSKQWNQGVPFRLSADFSRRKSANRIEGYFNSTSLRCGQAAMLTLVGAPKATATIYRAGYYQGIGARQVGQFSISSGWTFKATSKYSPGIYLIKLSAAQRQSSFVPITISSPDLMSDLTLISSVLTWQSYNQWGGYSLYKGPDGKRETRADSVSFLRPYDGDGSGQYQYMEAPLVKSAEKLGLNLNYATDIDLDKDSNLLKNTGSILLGGHSEYWTINMRNAVEAAVNRGVNLLVLGGNTAYNQIEISKDQISNIKAWREIGKPEIELLGSQYLALGFHRDMVIETQMWPFNVLPKGSIIKGVVGFEADTPITFKGPPVETVARSSIAPNEKSVPAMATYYTRSSGAGILNMATNGWVCAIEDKCPWGHRFDRQTQLQITRVTDNILQATARGPLGKWRMAFTQNNAPS